MNNFFFFHFFERGHMSVMNDLPVEILTNELASWLSPREISTCRCVCRLWNGLFSDERIHERVRAVMDDVRGSFFFLHELPGEWRLNNLYDGVRRRCPVTPFEMNFHVRKDHPVAEMRRCYQKKRGLDNSEEEYLVFTSWVFSRHKKFIRKIEGERREALAQSLRISEAKLLRLEKKHEEAKIKYTLALPRHYQ